MNDVLQNLAQARADFKQCASDFLEKSVRLTIGSPNGLNMVEKVIRQKEWTEIYNEVQGIVGYLGMMVFPVEINGFSAIKGVYKKGTKSTSPARNFEQECHVLSGSVKVGFSGMSKVYTSPDVFVVPHGAEVAYEVLEELFFVTIFKPKLPSAE